MKNKQIHKRQTETRHQGQVQNLIITLNKFVFISEVLY